MASTGGADAPPTATQLLFARAVILTMELWPAMRLAVSEQWGGVESADKRDFLVSHICDTYSNEPSVAQQQQHVGPAHALNGPATPDVDDLAETLEMYFDDEYESRIEDGSADWVAGRIIQLHKAIYAVFPPTQESLAAAQAEVDKLYEATVRLRGQKVDIQRTRQTDGHDVDGSGDSDDSDDDEENDGAADGAAAAGRADDAMDVDQSSSRPGPRELPQPIVDDEGFTTVVKGRRR